LNKSLWAVLGIGVIYNKLSSQEIMKDLARNDMFKEFYEVGTLANSISRDQNDVVSKFNIIYDYLENKSIIEKKLQYDEIEKVKQGMMMIFINLM
jgi:hypothetical protein